MSEARTTKNAKLIIFTDVIAAVMAAFCFEIILFKGVCYRRCFRNENLWFDVNFPGRIQPVHCLPLNSSAPCVTVVELRRELRVNLQCIFLLGIFRIGIQGLSINICRK